MSFFFLLVSVNIIILCDICLTVSSLGIGDPHLNPQAALIEQVVVNPSNKQSRPQWRHHYSNFCGACNKHIILKLFVY